MVTKNRETFLFRTWIYSNCDTLNSPSRRLSVQSDTENSLDKVWSCQRHRDKHPRPGRRGWHQHHPIFSLYGNSHSFVLLEPYGSSPPCGGYSALKAPCTSSLLTDAELRTGRASCSCFSLPREVDSVVAYCLTATSTKLVNFLVSNSKNWLSLVFKPIRL